PARGCQAYPACGRGHRPPVPGTHPGRRAGEGADPMTLTAQLSTLESSGLIRLAQVDPELEYLFRHALVQEAAYSSLLQTDQKRLHREVGEALEHSYPDRLDSRELAPVLGHHFAQA